jgi:hypothetical protein
LPLLEALAVFGGSVPAVLALLLGGSGKRWEALSI